MTGAAVSVVIVSRGRPAHLALCLAAVEQLYHPRVEVVVIADAAGCAAVAPLQARIRLVRFDEPNISAARNLGIAAAAGGIVAFLDDDAVPEPTWLDRLTAPFADPRIAAAGGLVRGRNGLSVQWGARQVLPDGTCAPLDPPAGRWWVPDLPPGHALKTEGTNMAVRRTVLRDLGGFDPAFAFYLDETDLNLRLAAAGHASAFVPEAEVHHGMAPSGRRRSDRMPLSLHDIGASSEVFWRKHATPDPQAARAALRAEQRRRALRHMVAGNCEPRDVARLLETLEQGLREGGTRAFGTASTVPLPGTPRLLHDAPPVAAATIVAGPLWRATSLSRQAMAARRDGKVVTLLRLSPTSLYHRVRFTPAGLWLHTGGWYGRAARDEPLFRATTWSARIRALSAKIAAMRHPETAAGAESQ